MSVLTDAKAHLAKAREFLEAAELSNDLGLYNAATSNAATSGINSKDAICLALTGRTGKTENHAEAIAELKATGAVGRAQAATLDRLVRLKPKSQYQAASISASDATKAIGWATRLLEAAEGVGL
jgi:hypothetical protein